MKILITFISFLFVTSSAFATGLTDNIKTQWQNSMNGQEDFYLPLHTWHNRYTYSPEKIATFNEDPYGLGYGRSYVDDKGNWHGFYAMAFSDSHNNIEPVAGYGYTKNWKKHNITYGAGYTILVTAREDINHYMPIAGVLPLLSVSYKKVTLSGTYVPGGKNNGNIAFFWGRYNFN